jgi:hypothetical protein
LAERSVNVIDGGALLVPAPNRWRKAARIAAATLVVIVLAITMSGTGLYFLLRGDTIENSVLTRNIEASIQRLLGPNFLVELGPTYFSFDPDGLLSLESTQVSVIRASDKQVVSTLGKVIVGIKPLSILSGSPAVDAVIVEDSTLDAALVPFAFGAVQKPDIASILGGIGAQLERAREEFSSERFRLFQFRNVTIGGLSLARLDPGPVKLEKLDLRFRRKKDLTLSAMIVTSQSSIDLRANYSPSASQGQDLVLKLAGLNLREWAQDPGGDEGPVGSDALVEISGLIPFAPDGAPGEATMEVATSGSSLRLGLEAITDLHELKLALRLRPAENDIQLENSRMLAGAVRAQLSGAVWPTEGNWAAGPFVFNLVLDPVLRQPTIAGEESVAASFNVEGGYLPAQRRLDFSKVLVRAGEDTVNGSASLVFNGATPALAASFKGGGLDVAAVKQFWPFFIAPAARNWAHRSIAGGRLSNLELTADLPPGVVGRLRKGARMEPDEFELKASFAQTRISAFGELPPITGAAGDFLMKGMTLEARLAGGVTGTQGGEVPVEAGSFRIADIGIRPNIADLRISTSGPVNLLAAIAESRPLTVLSRIDLKPEMVSGTGNIDVAAQFPLKRGILYEEVQWSAIADLKGASSTGKIFDRSIEQANVQVQADPSQVRVNGTATVDGTKTTLAMVEPIGGSGVTRERAISARLDEAARKKMGLVLDPVLTGVIKVELKQMQDGGEKQTIDLKDATLNLPWVGWTKGKGIPAQATFLMKSAKGVTYLDDFYIEGEGFSAVGKLTLDKGGLLSADFVNISLNQNDSFSLKLSRKGRNYKVDASGLRYDARALLDRLFHGEGFGEEQGTSAITVTANISEVGGYNGKVLRNVEMVYGAKGGWLDQLTLRGTFNDAYINVFANTRDGRTTFEIDSTNAGDALSFVDIYRKMQGGSMRARLERNGNGPFTGPVRATNFTVVGEPRIKMLVNEPSAPMEGRENTEITTQLRKLDTSTVRLQEARGRIEKGDGYFRVTEGVINNAQIGFTFDGLVYDKEGRMDMSGTFLPVIGISRVIGQIPIVGEILGNGQDSGLFGITYRLRGPARNPNIEINPMSVVAPGIFRKVFEYQKEQN